ncbi:MAG TPA: NAD(P)-binding domain-containing protein [Pseudomonadales bacterium]|nr:NAD(P)-binding domain-containing protein [Pseudomonadales bacterium]
MVQPLPRVCIIGAGSSGITACKEFAQKNIPFDCIEASDGVGGMWRFGNPFSSAAYRSLHINTSKKALEYYDFPMPEGTPDFPHHTHLAQYFDDYVDHFNVRKNIIFNTMVERATRRDDGVWEVTLSNGEVREYDALVVANGHHWNPKWPEPRYPGVFSGIEMHSHEYVDINNPVSFIGKTVLVVGMGSSAMDIACELGNPGVAKKVFLSARRGVYILPKYIQGKTFDAEDRHPSQPASRKEKIINKIAPSGYAPNAIAKRMTEAVGHPENYGLPKPEHDPSEAQPAISHEIFIRIGSGDVVPKAKIKNLLGQYVEFEDGSKEQVDIIIYCTGYKISFPFFEKELLDTSEDNDVALYKRIADPRYDNLFFQGLVQPWCGMMPLANEQAKWMARYISGEYYPPEREVRMAEAKLIQEGGKASFAPSKHHSIEVVCQPYCDDLREEMEQGYLRAAKHGFKPLIPVKARAGVIRNVPPTGTPWNRKSA